MTIALFYCLDNFSLDSSFKWFKLAPGFDKNELEFCSEKNGKF
jgi:hypothetical protein